jgi:hypothetical protein
MDGKGAGRRKQTAMELKLSMYHKRGDWVREERGATRQNAVC